jgi:outer membrane protein OmpA-like peptidoglycan-associated protein
VRPPEGASLGDVRLGVRGRLVGQSDQSPLQLGLEGYVFAPTAPADQYVGEGSLRSDLRLLLGGRAGPVVWSASGGAHLRTSENPHSIRFGLGAAVLILDERVSLGLQTHGTYPLGQTTLVATSETAVTSEAQPGLELLAEARLRVVSGLTIGAAGGPGDPTKDGCPPPDRDKDGVVDLDDACPLVNGDKNPDAEKNGCPNDGDGDGTPDRDDPCPKEKGLVGENKKKPGCPADADDDGVFDSVDACPSKAGISAPEPEQLGCPADMDNDGVAYPNDACPRERGPADAEKKGCPRFLKRNGSALETSRPVELSSSFSKSLSVTADSTPVLEEIRLYLEDHPEIGKLEVQGHTDDTGDVKKKLAISQDEAEIVVRALVDLGVPAARLAARGYGHKKPIADNRNPEGRRKNHRIAFEVLEGAK